MKNNNLKKWAKHLKLCPMLNKISNTIGRAPKCNSKGPKKEVTIIVDSKKKKK